MLFSLLIISLSPKFLASSSSSVSLSHLASNSFLSPSLDHHNFAQFTKIITEGIPASLGFCSTQSDPQHQRKPPMEGDSWSRFSAASKRHQSTLQSRFDLYLGLDDFEGGDEDLRVEFACPFCAEDFDIVGLCCHIDEEHPVEAKNGVCPVCVARVGMDMVNHITTQHGNLFKTQRRRRFRRGSSGSNSTLSLLRKELREGNLQSLFGGSSYTIAPSNAAPDPLLSSFITNLSEADPSREDEPDALDVRNVINEAVEEKAVESTQPVLSDKDQEERARRSEFVQGVVLSTIFDDIL